MSGGLRTGCELAAAALAGVLLRALLPLPPGDPFHSTLLILPLVVAGLRAADRLAVAAGARPLQPLGAATGAAEGLALLALALVAVEHRALGVAGVQGVVAAALLLLLAHRLGRTVVGLAPLVAQAARRRPSAVFFLLPLVVYLALLPWSSEHRPPDGDEPYYLLITHSLLQDGDADLADDYAAGESRRFVDRAIAPQPGDPRSHDGGVYSRHNLLLPLLLTPGLGLAGRWGALATMTALAALLAWLTLRLLARLFPERPAAVLLAWAAFVFSPPLLLYSYQVWIEVPAAILVAVAGERLLARRREAWRRRDLAMVAAAIALLPLLKLRLGLVAAPLVVVAFWPRGGGRGLDRAHRRIATVTALALAGASALLVVHNQIRFGNPLKIHGWGELELLEKPLAAFARGLLGPFYDVAFGLFFAAPVWFLLVPGLALLLGERRRLAAAVAFLMAPYLLTLAPRIEWYGGWSPPFRYLLVFLPLLAAALVPVAARRDRPGVRALGSLLVALTFVATVFWIAIPGWTFNFADGQSLLLERTADRLGGDVGRFLPSYVRPRAASWLWPLASLLLVPIVLLGRRRAARRSPRTAGTASRLAGFAVLLALAIALPVAATRLPTRQIEAEDGQVVKRGGIPFPALWIPQRPRYPSGWLLTGGSWITAPVAAAGERVTLTVTARFLTREPTPYGLRLSAGDRVLAEWDGHGRPEGWGELVVGPVDWPAGARLSLAAPFAGGPGDNAVAIDRVDLAWQAAGP